MCGLVSFVAFNRISSHEISNFHSRGSVSRPKIFIATHISSGIECMSSPKSKLQDRKPVQHSLKSPLCLTMPDDSLHPARNFGLSSGGHLSKMAHIPFL